MLYNCSKYKKELVPFQGLPVLSDEEEQVSALPDEEQEDQLAEMQGGETGETEAQEEVQQQQQTEASSVSALSNQQLEQDGEDASENQRPGLGALSAKQPEHTSPAQTSVSQRHVRRRRKKKVDPAFVY